jgi:hypothetical protein
MGLSQNEKYIEIPQDSKFHISPEKSDWVDWNGAQQIMRKSCGYFGVSFIFYWISSNSL